MSESHGTNATIDPIERLKQQNEVLSQENQSLHALRREINEALPREFGMTILGAIQELQRGRAAVRKALDEVDAPHADGKPVSYAPERIRLLAEERDSAIEDLQYIAKLSVGTFEYYMTEVRALNARTPDKAMCSEATLLASSLLRGTAGAEEQRAAGELLLKIVRKALGSEES